HNFNIFVSRSDLNKAETLIFSIILTTFAHLKNFQIGSAIVNHMNDHAYDF
ncbi:MAG: hypothetical protein ACD_4C00012G0001, partial [uncultured bacterium (gcode 4)]